VVVEGKSHADRFKELYDVERHVMATDGGILVEDPYPAWAELRASAPVHQGTVRELMGYDSRGGLGGAHNRTVYSAFSFQANDIAFRDNEVFSSTFYQGLTTQTLGKNMLEMVGAEHRRYRALAQPAFTPKRAQWWIDKWIQWLVDEAMADFEHVGRAELNAEFCSRIPLQTITSSFGLTRDEALDFREGSESGMAYSAGEGSETARDRGERTTAMLKRVIEARRAEPRDDVITMLVQSEIEEDGQRHLLSDDEIYGFARLILTAGSGTTWRQLGILLVALLRQPDLLDAIRHDRELLKGAVEEVLRWEPTATIIRRLVLRDIELCGVKIPSGSVIELNMGAANRDPERWENPDRFDPSRKIEPNLAFVSGPHVCLGMHVARAEMTVAMNAVLDRLPNLRFDPDAPAARIIGLEHRGPNGVPVVFG
jgi:cytochrome P450